MTWTVILALGSGNLQEGFSHITAQLQNQARSISIQQFKGSLPPAADIEVLHRRWKAACTGLQYSRSDARIKVNYASTTHVSETNPGAIYEGLKKEIQSWLKTDDFYSQIEVKLRTRIGNPSEAVVQIFLECDDSQISELPMRGIFGKNTARVKSSAVRPSIPHHLNRKLKQEYIYLQEAEFYVF